MQESFDSGLGPGRSALFTLNKTDPLPLVGAVQTVVLTLKHFADRLRPRAGDVSFECLPYHTFDGTVLAYHGDNG